MIKAIQIKPADLGVTFTETGEATVHLWSPLTQQIDLYLPECDVTLPLERAGPDCWSLTTSRLRPGDLYQFIVNGEKKRPDPASRSQPQGVHGPSQAIDLRDGQWTDASWSNPPLSKYLIYELHVGTFTPAGTFAAVEEKLDHLLDLGINAIEIMPVASFFGSRNWGYDGVYPYAVQSTYGGAAGLKHLVDTCHQKGIAVILDVVYNHFGAEGNYLTDYGPYLTSKYFTPWGEAMNFDGSWCDGVRHYFTENAVMWLRDFHVDALRLDAIHHMLDFSPNHILRQIRQAVDKLMTETGRSYYLLGECDLNDPRYINPLPEYGYGMDAQWSDEFHHALRVAAGGERDGYFADFEGIRHLAKSYRDAYVYDGQFSTYRKRHFGTRAETNPGQQFIVFSQNHDQIGNRLLGERSSQSFSREMVRLMAGAVLISPYVPLLFMGEEWGETNPFLFFAQFDDPELGEKVRQGRKKEFSDFQAKSAAPDPLDPATFEQSKLQWHLREHPDHQALFAYYKTLIALRKQHPVLRVLHRWQLALVCQEEQNLLLLHRWEGNHHVLGLINFSPNPQSITWPDLRRHWTKQIDSADRQWGGPGTTAPAATSGTEPVMVQPQSLVLYDSVEGW